MLMLLRPRRRAATCVEAAPVNGSKIVSPTKLNNRINRSANIAENCAG